jgi:ABC-2 type transport system ATP-binding protein
VRELILRLRDRGCTVFFSSHVLSDAEALCSRVAILANGRLAAIGALDELTSVGSRGWELVVSGLSADVLARVNPRLTRATSLGDGRFSLELPPSTIPEQLIPDLGGARIVSLNPLRGTLEDVFVEQVRATGGERFSEKVAS